MIGTGCRVGRVCVAALVVLLAAAGAVSERGAGAPVVGGEEGPPVGLSVPRVRARPIPITPAPKPNRLSLPAGATALFPAFNGDSVFVALRPTPAGSLTGAQVYRAAVLPVLRSLRFPKTAGRFDVPKGTGRQLAGASLARLATQVCIEFLDPKFERLSPGVRELCDVMRGLKPPSAGVERAFQTGEGMSFAQFKADLERARIQYAFRQLVGRVPIEHAGLIATRFAGETTTIVHGVAFTRFVVANRVALTAEKARLLGLERLRRVKGVVAVDRKRRMPADLVLLPYGGSRLGATLAPALRYAYRQLVFGRIKSQQASGQGASWIAYFDAQTAAILELVPQIAEVSAVGRAWRRAPDTATQLIGFDVDASTGGQYTLERNDGANGVFNRVDRLGNGTFGDGEVSISDSSGGSSATFANFDQSPLNDSASAICSSGGNNSFRQVNAFAHLSRLREIVVSAGTFPTFPEFPITIWVDTTSASGNNAWYDAFGSGKSRLEYVIGAGYSDPSCPNGVGLALSGTHDPTSMGHEFGHLAIPRLQDRRPSDWCGSPPCQMPTGRLLFHDFADALGHAYASINCQAGWSRKNVGSANGSLNCVGNTSEGGGLPRLSQVNVPFNPAAPGDHFPEHRTLATGDYADGQIAAAALWAVRQGMRSKCLPSGTPQYFVRLMRALWNFGFLSTTCVSCDRDIYRFLQDLMRQMVQQWATSGQPGGPPGFAHNGAHTTNKVTSGFARAGLFLIPYQCVDGDTATTDPSFCPGGENGGDAIIDVDDNDASDDPTIDSVVHPERDYLRRLGTPPTFHVWTGPRYKFDAAGTATGFTPSAATPAPCYVQYQVEASNDPNFATGVVSSTPSGGSLRTVSTTTSPECYATWTLSASDWTALRGTTGETRVYYRVRTRNAAGDTTTERVSTQPGNGLYTVPAPYAIVNDSGSP